MHPHEGTRRLRAISLIRKSRQFTGGEDFGSAIPTGCYYPHDFYGSLCAIKPAGHVVGMGNKAFYPVSEGDVLTLGQSISRRDLPVAAA